MRTIWEKRCLGELCTLFTDGDWIETKDQSISGIRLIQTGNVGESIFKNRLDKARWITQSKFDELKCQEVLPGDILISRLPDPVGRACIIPQLGVKCITGVDCSIVRLSHEIDANWFIRYSQSKAYQAQIESSVTGTTRKRISRKNLGKVEIPLPPLEEQKRIAGILDEADRVRKKTQALIDKYDELAQSLFLDMFGDPVTNPKGWEVKTLVDVVSNEKHSLKRGPFGGALKKEIFKKDGFKVYEQGNAIRKRVEEGSYFIDESKYREMMAFSIQPGDFIASCSGTIGELFRIPKGAPQGIINQALMKITVDEDIVLPEFFESLFRYHIKDHIFISGSKGSGLKNVSSMKIIKEAVFIVPDLLSQKRFVDINKSLSEQKGGILKGLKSADCAFNALLQKAFKGELT